MADIRSTVLVTVTEYTTVHPESLLTMASSAIPTLTRASGRSMQSSSLSGSSLVSSPTLSTLSTSQAIPTQSASRSSLSSSTVLSGVTGLPPLPTAFDPPKPGNATGGQHLEWKSSDNTLLIIFSIAVVLIALAYVIALLYFVWWYARGHCAGCNAKEKEIAKLIMRRSRCGGVVTPVMFLEDVEAQLPVRSPPPEPLQFPRPLPKAATNRTPKYFADRSTKSTVAELDFIAAHRAEAFDKLNSGPSPLTEILSYTDDHTTLWHHSVSLMSSPVNRTTLTPDTLGSRILTNVDLQDPIPESKNPYALNAATRNSRDH